jgi:hypothetical protein
MDEPKRIRGTKKKPGVPTKPKYPQVVKFSKVTIRMFQEMLIRQVNERNQALIDVYEEIGLLPRLQMQSQTGEFFEILPGYTGVKITLMKEDNEEGSVKKTEGTDKGTE